MDGSVGLQVFLRIPFEGTLWRKWIKTESKNGEIVIVLKLKLTNDRQKARSNSGGEGLMLSKFYGNYGMKKNGKDKNQDFGRFLCLSLMILIEVWVWKPLSLPLIKLKTGHVSDTVLYKTKKIQKSGYHKSTFKKKSWKREQKSF